MSRIFVEMTEEEYQEYCELKQENENAKLKGQVNYLTEVAIEFRKMLKIIKEKDVDIFMLNDLDTLEDYNGCISIKYGEYYQLTQEEYDLLERYFKKESK